ncbi:hypothetical protein GLOTRDRAFT_111147 [Gloeophyllum trabeum ATCC 11539]|uniref:Uncharacterized protein n=1 Tax=Gloeophyllum trabeum (strain ATCC 11539 / FP-39264 / Madison 617) TaxID=670483 RepID=S7RLB0_GLOTA|nr:uncharacterized protein GLOTRDRAFT_111147 [Gloeophyllum trabeum ATCC 11539]EPQ55175.1 hypothetical protein GLOTRDRAFT_111147 [Gloeophyllum trabeum ATCC 11539]
MVSGPPKSPVGGMKSKSKTRTVTEKTYLKNFYARKKVTKASSMSSDDGGASKRIKREDKMDKVLTFLEEERAERQAFQSKVLSQIERGNELYAREAQDNHNFRQDFLALMRAVIEKH